jgi:rubrerythrin
MFSIYEIVDLAVRIEENGEHFYRNLSKDVMQPALEQMFRWLADAEVQHREWFMKLKEQLRPRRDKGQLEAIGGSILQEILGARTFSLEDADFSKVTNVGDLIKIALEFEKDTILFFEIIQGLADDEKTNAGLRRIIAEENNHVRMLQELRGKDTTSADKRSARTGEER